LTITLVSALLGHLYVGRRVSGELSAAVAAKKSKWKAKREGKNPEGPASTG